MNLDSTPRREFLAGCHDVVPLLPGLVPFGLVAGVAAIAAIAAGMPVLWLAQWAIR